VLLRSLQAYPCNWGGWLALAALCGPGQQVEPHTDLPLHWARDFYLVHICLDAQLNDEALSRLQARPWRPH